MANWSLPTLSSTYTNFLSELQARDTDLALAFDGTTTTSQPTGTVRWDSTANRWKKWNGTSWAELTATYALTALSTTGAATIGTTLGVTGQTTLATATATTPSTADNNTNIATTAFVKAQGYATLAGPTFTGTVTIPTGASIAGYLTTAAAASAYAPLAGPTFTGTVTIPAGASITGYLTTATAASTYAPLASPTFTGNVIIPAGTVTANGIQVGTGATYRPGLYSPATDQLAIATAGSGRLLVDSVGRFQVTGPYDGNVTIVPALNLDLSASNYFTKTINATTTFTVSNTPSFRAFSFTLELTHTSGGITWFTGVEWPGGAAPTLTTGKTHLFMFVTDDGGTRWRAASLINYTN